MKKTMPIFLLAVVAAFVAGTMFSFTPANTGIGDTLSYKAKICACKNSGECFEGLPGASCKFNVLTNAGKEAIEDYLVSYGNVAGANFTYLAVGNGTAPVAANTSLSDEITTGGLARAAATVTDWGDGNWSLLKQWTASATHYSVNSTGIFNESSGGTFFAGGTYTAVNLEANDQLTINYSVWVDTG